MDDRFQTLRRGHLAAPRELRRAVFDDHDRRIGHLTDGDGQAGERKQVDGLVGARKGQGREERAEQQDAHGRHGRPQVLERNGNNEDDHHQLVADRLKEVLERFPDQGRAVIGRDNLNACWQGGLQGHQALLEGVRHRQNVTPLLHDGNAAHHLAVAVQVGNAPSEVVANLQVAHVAQPHDLAGPVPAQHEVLELVEVVAIDRAAQLVFTIRDFNRSSACLLKRIPERGQDLLERNASLTEQRRQQPYLILFFESSHRRDFSHAGGRLQGWLDRALVQEAQFTQVAGPLLVHECVLENPSDAAGVRADHDVRIGRQLRPDGIETVADVLPNGCPAPSVLQDHVDKRVPHVRGASDRLDLWRAGQGSDDRLGHFRFDDERASRPLAVYDDLRI